MVNFIGYIILERIGIKRQRLHKDTETSIKQEGKGIYRFRHHGNTIAANYDGFNRLTVSFG